MTQEIIEKVNVANHVLHYSSPSVAENALVLKAQPGFFIHVSCVTNVIASDRFIMVFDKATAPVNGDVPIRRATIPLGAQFGQITAVFAPPVSYGIGCAAGVSVALSTTSNVLTLPAGNEGRFGVDYL